jgi:protein-S-isoprenylcysteine O-methyltransferase Ste14
MYVGVSSILVGETLLFNSRNLLLLVLLFVCLQAINVPIHEERVLRKSFGQEYILYCKHVPRWLPRITPYHHATKGE